MLKIRLARFGKKNAPTYKVVVSRARDKRNGKFIDIIGHFNPQKTPMEIEIDKKKLEEWIGKGAHTTEAVDKLVKGTYKYVKYSPSQPGDSESSENSDNKEKIEPAEKV